MKLETSIALTCGIVTLIVSQGYTAQTGYVVEWGHAQVMPVVQPNTRFTAVAAGAYHSLALQSNGVVVAWGDNTYGASQVPVGLTNVVAIAAGSSVHSLALTSNGMVVAWGWNYYGETNIPTGLKKAVAIAAGDEYNLVLNSEGTVVGWGEDSYGETNVPAGLSNVVAIAAGWHHCLALKTGGKIVPWGDNTYGQTNLPNGLSNIVAIAAGGYHCLALKPDGSVVAWGASASGQVSVPAGFSNVIAIAAGGYHSLALKSDGTVAAWGANYYGQSTVPAGLTNVIAIAAGGYHSLALKSDGSVVAWGYNFDCQSTVPGALNDMIAIAAGPGYLALNSVGTVVAWGDNTYLGETNVPTGLSNVVAIAARSTHYLALKSNGTVVAWGAGLTNNPTDGINYGQSLVPTGLSNVVAIAAGYAHSLALKSDGTVAAWGMNTYGQCTIPSGLSNVIAIAGGGYHSLALRSNGSVAAWGYNSYGESTVPINLSNVIAVSGGDLYSMALKSDGMLIAWGNRYNLPPTGLSNLVAVADGLALKSDGTVVTWETDSDSAFGLSDVPIGLRNVIAIASGGDRLALVATPNQSPLILNQPSSQMAQVGNNAIFSALVIGAFPLSYQWQFSGQNLTGQTAASLSLTNVQFANAGGYSVVVTNTYGSATSAVAQLTVFTNLVVTQTNKPPPPPGNPTIPTDATHFKVFTNGTFASGIGLDPNKSTIVLTHGWKESSATWPLDMANNIKFELGSSTPNIVAWDWTTKAAQPLPAATLETQGQGYALGENLTNALGANYSHRIHFIGHSLGTLVNARAANFIHTNGFAWANTQMTLFDDAEVAWGLVGDSWATLTSLLQNDSSPQQDWKHPLPDQCAWADNYITAVGMPHPQAVNVILTNLTPDVSNIQNLFDFGIGAWTGQFKTEITDYHNYSYIWYNNTVSQINNPNDPPYLMGFIRSWEGGGYAGRPSANTYYIESQNCPPSFPSYSGYDPAYNLVQINSDQVSQYLDARPQNLISQVGVNLVSSTDNILANNNNQQIQLLNGPTVSASSQITGPAYAVATLIKLFTTSLINGLVHPLGGPVPLGGGSANSPAYVWIPVTVPSNALTMAFNFMLQGNGNQDSFQVAMNTNNLMTVETVLIQTNVTMSSGMIDVSQYAGQQAELFFGIVGGTSTNASLTISGISFYVTLPPSLQIQLAGTNVVLTWPLSATGYVLQSANQLTPPIAWTTVTNVPVIVNFQYTVTNQVSSGSRFYRLAIITAPALQAQVLGSNFILSWPASASGYFLETTTNLAAANSWTAVTNTPATVNQQSVVTNQISGASRFYRLRE